MKLAQVLLKQVIPGSGVWSTSLFTVSRGFDLTLNEESRMVAIRHGETVRLVAVENTHYCDPLPAEKATKK